MSGPDTELLTAHVSPALAQKIGLLAERFGRSRGWVVEEALTAWVEQEEERDRLTREALADVDAGRVTGHEAVQAWADSLGAGQPAPLPAIE